MLLPASSRYNFSEAHMAVVGVRIPLKRRRSNTSPTCWIPCARLQERSCWAQRHAASAACLQCRSCIRGLCSPLQDGSGGHLLFCQHGAATLRCAALAFTGPAKGSREKQGGQLRADAKKPIVALVAHPCDRRARMPVSTGPGVVSTPLHHAKQPAHGSLACRDAVLPSHGGAAARRQAVLVLHADGALACCAFSFSARALALRWSVPVELPRAVIIRVLPVHACTSHAMLCCHALCFPACCPGCAPPGGTSCGACCSNGLGVS